MVKRSPIFMDSDVLDDIGDEAFRDAAKEAENAGLEATQIDMKAHHSALRTHSRVTAETEMEQADTLTAQGKVDVKKFKTKRKGRGGWIRQTALTSIEAKKTKETVFNPSSAKPLPKNNLFIKKD